VAKTNCKGISVTRLIFERNS